MVYMLVSGIKCENGVMFPHDEDNSLSKRTTLEGPAISFLAGMLDLLLTLVVGCTSIVRASAVFCFFLSLPVSAGTSSGLRFGGM